MLRNLTSFNERTRRQIRKSLNSSLIYTLEPYQLGHFYTDLHPGGMRYLILQDLAKGPSHCVKAVSGCVAAFPTRIIPSCKSVKTYFVFFLQFSSFVYFVCMFKHVYNLLGNILARPSASPCVAQKGVFDRCTHMYIAWIGRVKGTIQEKKKRKKVIATVFAGRQRVRDKSH